MIGFALRLTLAGGREAIARLVVIAAAVALGVGLLLVAVAGLNAVDAKNLRDAWLNSGTEAAARSGTATGAPLWWVVREDYYDGRAVGRVDLAATGPDSPVPPGIPRLPGPGEFYASPALAELLRTTPPAELAHRYPGHQVGVIGPAALPAPNSLVIIIGGTPEQVAHLPGAKRIDHLMTTSPSRCDGCVVGYDAEAIDLILSVVAGALLFPVLIFIGTASRLAAARREQRFAAMRLVGATPRQVTTIATVESTVAAVAGTAIGFGLFSALRHWLAGIPFTGEPFYPDDLSLTVVDILVVARVPAHHGRAGARGSVADHGRRPADGAPGPPPGRADRRAAPGRRPEGRLPRGQWTGARPVRHERGARSDHHDRGRTRPAHRQRAGRQYRLAVLLAGRPGDAVEGALGRIDAHLLERTAPIGERPGALDEVRAVRAH